MIKFLVKKHSGALILALIAGTLMVLPFFYFQSKLDSNFKGVFPEIVNDELFYYARIKDIADGHFFLGNAYLFEHKNTIPQQLNLGEYFLALPIKLFNLSVNTAHLIYNFFLPAIAFILTYLAFYLIFKTRLWAIILSGFLFFGLFPLDFIRPISPQFNFIFWLTQFIFLYLFLNNPDSKKFWFFNALNFGFLFYIYPYYWSFYLILFGLLTVFYFFKNKHLAVKIFTIVLSGLILAIPYFYLNYLSFRLPYYTETLTRLGMVYTHFPSYANIVCLDILALMVFYWALRKEILTPNSNTAFFMTGILTSIIGINQNMITGRDFQFSGHYNMCATFFLMLAASYFLCQILPDSIKRASNIKLAIIVILLIIIFLGLKYYRYWISAPIDADDVYIQRYVPIFAWLNNNTAPDSVIYANEQASKAIPVYTADNVFYHRYGNLFFISDQEALERFIINNFFVKFDDQFIVKNAKFIFGIRFNELPDGEITKVINRAQLLQKESFAQELKKYRVDYFIWDKNKNPDWELEEFLKKPVFQVDDIVIYRAD